MLIEYHVIEFYLQFLLVGLVGIPQQHYTRVPLCNLQYHDGSVRKGIS